MQHVNGWLMALSFVLGLVLTFALPIRRVKREVPEDATLAAGAGAGAATAGAATGGAAAEFADTSGDETAKIAAVTEEPFGPGSARVAAGAGAPPGWTVKGNEDSMLYHTPESPTDKRTIAEVWFRDEPTAQAAGFDRWDSGKSQRVKE